MDYRKIEDDLISVVIIFTKTIRHSKTFVRLQRLDRILPTARLLD